MTPAQNHLENKYNIRIFKAMKAKTFTTTFGGIKRTHCTIIIEEIKVTDPKDIKRMKALDEQNRHNDARKIAAKYTDNQLFKDIVARIEELDEKNCKSSLTDAELAEHQALVAFTKHFDY